MTDYSIKRYSAYSDDELVEALRNLAARENVRYVSARRFSEVTGISEATVARHFQTWATFCHRAGLAPRYARRVGREDLLENLDRVWQRLGRQPRAKEMKQPLSPISISKYQKVFGGSWHAVCLALVAWKSGLTVSQLQRETPQITSDAELSEKHRRIRTISLPLRYEILKRDSFRCVKCGRSPATTPSVQLHVDHVVPWSEEGPSDATNLQTLCAECNLGKGARRGG
jgi:hypothetical protein